MKKCTKCGIIGKHNKHKDMKDKLQTTCVACKKANHEENRDARRAQQKEYRSRPESKEKIHARRWTRYANVPAYRTREILRKALQKFLKGAKRGRRTLTSSGVPRGTHRVPEKSMSPETREALEAVKRSMSTTSFPNTRPISILRITHVRAIYHYTTNRSTNRRTFLRVTTFPKVSTPSLGRGTTRAHRGV